MLRDLILLLSKRREVQRLLMGVGLTRALVRRFVAGDTLQEALGAVRFLNKRGLVVTLDRLGENVITAAEAVGAAEDYITILQAIQVAGVTSHVSLKLTQLGLDLGEELARRNLLRVAAEAANLGSFVRIDMEGSVYTDATLQIFRAARERYGRVGVVIQANLRRSARDLEGLIDGGANIRLCKGAYKEPRDIAFQRKGEVNANYLRLLRTLMSPQAKAAGAHPAIATHDPRMIAAAQELANGLWAPGEFEFQMLYGIRRDLQQELADQGHTVRIYVPYGTHWYPYLMRRLAERPANVLFLLRHLLRA
jgi:proline dehydrogenase